MVSAETMMLRSMVLVSWILAVAAFPSILTASEVGDMQTINSDMFSSYDQLYEFASNGSASAQYELGLLYEYGRGVNQVDTSAVYWYKKSAAQFFPNALYRLAILYDNGWGLEINRERALEFYKLAAERGHQLAQHDLAIMYFQGTGTSRNLLEAYKWLKIAVLSGNPLMQKHLTMVAKEMLSDEIALAESLAGEWYEYSTK